MALPSYLISAVCLLILIEDTQGWVQCEEGQSASNQCEQWWWAARSPLNTDHGRLECLRMLKAHCGVTVTVEDSHGHRPHGKPQAKVTAKFSYANKTHDTDFVADKDQIRAAGL